MVYFDNNAVQEKFLSVFIHFSIFTLLGSAIQNCEELQNTEVVFT